GTRRGALVDRLYDVASGQRLHDASLLEFLLDRDADGFVGFRGGASVLVHLGALLGEFREHGLPLSIRVGLKDADRLGPLERLGWLGASGLADVVVREAEEHRVV